MNSPIITRSLGLTSDYTVLGLISTGSIPFGPTYKSSSWKKFIRTSTRQSESETAMTFIVAATEGTTTERSNVVKPTPRDLLIGPLFQVAGMFAIGEPGWADKHDTYLAEIYVDSHADSK